MDRGEFREMDTGDVTQLIIAPVVMLMMWKHSFGACQSENIDPDRYLRSMIDLTLNGLQAKPLVV
jgi:hypothetical protein